MKYALILKMQMVILYFSAGDVDYAINGGYDFDNPGIVDTWVCLDPDACYTINMADAWGDGWNDAILTIGQQDGNTSEITLFAGSSGSAEYGYCPFECDFAKLLMLLLIMELEPILVFLLLIMMEILLYLVVNNFCKVWVVLT